MWPHCPYADRAGVTASWQRSELAEPEPLCRRPWGCHPGTVPSQSFCHQNHWGRAPACAVMLHVALKEFPAWWGGATRRTKRYPNLQMCRINKIGSVWGWEPSSEELTPFIRVCMYVCVFQMIPTFNYIYTYII